MAGEVEEGEISNTPAGISTCSAAMMLELDAPAPITATTPSSTSALAPSTSNAGHRLSISHQQLKRTVEDTTLRVDFVNGHLRRLSPDRSFDPWARDGHQQTYACRLCLIDRSRGAATLVRAATEPCQTQ